MFNGLLTKKSAIAHEVTGQQSLSCQTRTPAVCDHAEQTSYWPRRAWQMLTYSFPRPFQARLQILYAKLTASLCINCVLNACLSICEHNRRAYIQTLHCARFEVTSQLEVFVHQDGEPPLVAPSAIVLRHGFALRPAILRVPGEPIVDRPKVRERWDPELTATALLQPTRIHRPNIRNIHT